MTEPITREEVFEVLKKQLLATLEDLPEADIDDSQTMADLGANSLDIVEVVSEAMRELRVKVPRAELSGLKNIGELVDLLWRVARETPQTQRE